MTTEPLIMAGYFNIHVNVPSDNDAVRFLDLFPTHVSGNILDLLITRSSDSRLIRDVQPDSYFSDHCSVLFLINTSKPQLSRKEVSFRKIKAIDTTAFMEDLSASRLCLDPPSEPDKLVDCYNTTLAELLDQYAPLKTKSVTVGPQVPWYSDEIREAKRERRRAERRWRSTGTAADLVSFKRKKYIYVTHLLKKAKSAFLAEFIDQNADHQGKLFRAVKDLLVEKNTLDFSDYADKSALANDLGRYFVQKVIRLRDELDECAVADDTDTNSDLPTPLFIETFTPLSEEDVCRLIANKTPKSTSCCLDPIPTLLLKSCIEPVITKIINISLDFGIFPANWKVAVFIPLPKKLGVDSVFKNLRPVSNLAYISKLLERVVFNQIYDHIVRSGLYPLLQSAYRRHHSTETALVKVANDILLNMNSQRVTLLVLLDLSAAFDTVDHGILLRRLSTSFGIRGRALEWFSSYLLGRSQHILLDGVKSDSFDLRFGVPHGSCGLRLQAFRDSTSAPN